MEGPPPTPMKSIARLLFVCFLALVVTSPEAEASPPPSTPHAMAGPLNPAQTRVIDPILTNVVRGYRNATFVGNHLFPVVPVTVAGGQVIEFGKESFQRYNTRRARGGATRRVRFGYEGASFALENHAVEGQVAREDQRDAGRVPGIDLGRRALNMAMRVTALELEISQAEIALNPANYGDDHKEALAGNDLWADPDSSPITQINDYKETIRSQIGMEPNTLLLSALAFKNLKDHPALVEKIKYTSRDSITEAILAQLFDLERVVVGRGVYAANEDAANEDAAFTDIWQDDAVLAYVPTGSDGQTYAPGSEGDREQPSYGYTYTMEGHPAAEQPYYDNNTRSWIYPVSHERVAVLSGMAAGFLIQNAGAPAAG